MKQPPIQIPRHIGCDHCYCRTITIETGSELVSASEDGKFITTKPKYTEHRQCCNCRNTKI